MYPQPTAETARQYLANYEQFLAFIFFASFLFAWALLRYTRKRKALAPPPLWIALVLGLIVRLPLMQQPYWYDEAFTSAITQLRLDEMFIAITGDVHPPGYYLLVKLFTLALGHNDFVMRLPALLSGLAFIYVMYKIGAHYDERTGRWAALIVAILPNVVYYSTEARYPMFLALMLATAYAGIQRDKPGVIEAALTAAAAVHVNAWFSVVILLAVYVQKTGRVKTILSGVTPAIVILAWLPVAINQSSDVADGFWLVQYAVYMHIPEMTIGTGFRTAELGLFPLLIVLTVISVAVWTWRKRVTWRWLVVVVAPPVIQWLIGIIWHPVYLPRTLMFSALLLILPVAYWFAHGAYRPAMFAFIGACIFGAGMLAILPRDGDTAKALNECEGYDVIYATNVHTAILARHYSNADVYVYSYGNSSAQQLPAYAQDLLFSERVQFWQIADKSPCVIAQVSQHNTRMEMNHLTLISISYQNEEIISEVEGNDSVYYLIMRDFE